MEKQEFEAKISGLLPEYDRDAMKVWHQYAGEMEADGNITQARFYDELSVEFSLVAEQYGTELATELFSIANTSCLNPFEVRGASHHLHDGVPLADVAQLAIDGMCDTTAEEDEQSMAVLTALREDRVEPAHAKPSILAQLQENRQEKTSDTEQHPSRGQSGPDL